MRSQSTQTLVMKFGGKAVETPDRFPQMADIILKKAQSFNRIVVVVSAMGEMTNELIELAHKVHPDPPRREYDMLVSAGERISIALLAMVLKLKEKEAVSFTGSQCGIITNDDHASAKIIDVRPGRIFSAIDQGKIAIVAGFQGVSQGKEITTLGRGGSDTTAVALAIALNAQRVEFYKDVEGVFERDPKEDQTARFLSLLTYDEALEVVKKSKKKILHPRAILLAQKNNIHLVVSSFLREGKSSSIFLKNPEKSLSGPIYENF